MELERQVCSLKLAQRLRRLGVEQNSIWNWCKINHKWIVVWAYSEEPIKATQYAAAFTVAELGEMLPIVVEAGKAGTGLAEATGYASDGLHNDQGYSRSASANVHEGTL